MPALPRRADRWLATVAVISLMAHASADAQEKAAPPRAIRLDGRPFDRRRESSLVIKYDIPGGEPAARIHLHSTDDDRDIGTTSINRLTWTQVDNGGTLTVDHLAAGSYRISRSRLIPLLRRAGGGLYSETYFLDQTTVRLEDRATAEVSLIRPRGQKIAGRIEGLKDHGLAAAIVHVTSPEATGVTSLRLSAFTRYDVCATDEAGRFETEPLSSGRYKLLVAGFKLRDPARITPSDIDNPRCFAMQELVLEDGKPAPSVELKILAIE